MESRHSAWKVIPVGLLLAQMALAGCSPMPPTGGKSLAALVAAALPADSTPVAPLPAEPAPGKFEFVGKVESTASGTVTVDTRILSVTAATEISPDLNLGDPVKVEGLVMPDGSLLATEIGVAEGDHVSGSFEWSGTVTSLAGATWVIGGVTFSVPDGLAPADLAVGSKVKIEGVLGPDGQWVITSISLENDETGLENDDEVEQDDDVEEIEVDDDKDEVERQEIEAEHDQQHDGADLEDAGESD